MLHVLMLVAPALLLSIGLWLGDARAADTEMDQATGEVRSGARQIGEGKVLEGTGQLARGVGQTVVESARQTGHAVVEAGRTTGRAVRGGWQVATDAVFTAIDDTKFLLDRLTTW